MHGQAYQNLNIDIGLNISAKNDSRPVQSASYICI